jgi:hypothetical protein
MNAWLSVGAMFEVGLGHDQAGTILTLRDALRNIESVNL